MTLEWALVIIFAAGYFVVSYAYIRLRVSTTADYLSFKETFDDGAGIIEIAEQALLATAAYGAFMQELAFELVAQVEDPAIQNNLLEGMSGARYKYLDMLPTGDTTDPANYTFRLDTPPPPLEI
jgi:hypothetical protein